MTIFSKQYYMIKNFEAILKCALKRREDHGSHYYLRNRKHFPCFYRIIQNTRACLGETRNCVETLVFPRNFSFLPNFHKCFYNSIGTRKNVFCFLY